MCALNNAPDVAPPPAPPAPNATPKLKDPLSDLMIIGPNGQPTRRKTGLNSLKIDRVDSSTSLNIPD